MGPRTGGSAHRVHREVADAPESAEAFCPSGERGHLTALLHLLLMDTAYAGIHSVSIHLSLSLGPVLRPWVRIWWRKTQSSAVMAEYSSRRGPSDLLNISAEFPVLQLKSIVSCDPCHSFIVGMCFVLLNWQSLGSSSKELSSCIHPLEVSEKEQPSAWVLYSLLCPPSTSLLCQPFCSSLGPPWGFCQRQWSSAGGFAALSIPLQ